ncbi:glucose-fructose oxidoreductase [Halobacteriales archaeon QS_1_68_20]|nr:MAG: glucose-fructose oxidoreductase [Halobacteriales archaeon QS_1_68_20]
MNFGVLSTATIGQVAVIPAIQDTDHDVLAIASREADRAQEVAEEFDVPRSYGSYEALLEDDDLDAVYNPLPNALHAEWTKRAADRGLDVLCEKPLAVDAEQAREVGDYCEEQSVTLMEAFMYRYHPRTEHAVEIVREQLGELRTVHAAFHFPLPERYDVRLDPDLAGGSLMDVGCYAVSAARLFLGEPERVYATSQDARDSGVDTELSAHLEFDGGATATITSGFDSPDRQHYRVVAEDGWVRADPAFVPRGDDGVGIVAEVGDRHVEESFDPTDQYRLEVEHFAECVEQGKRPRTDADEAVRNMAVIGALYESAQRGQPVEVTVPGE